MVVEMLVLVVLLLLLLLEQLQPEIRPTFEECMRDVLAHTVYTHMHIAPKTITNLATTITSHDI